MTNSEACTLRDWLSKLILCVVMEIRQGNSDQNFTSKGGPTPKVMFTLNISMDLSILLLVLRWLV